MELEKIIEQNKREAETVPDEVLKQFKVDYPALALRVRDGNDKVMNAYAKIQDIDDEIAYNQSMEKIDKAASQLHLMALKLKAIEEVFFNKGECLYIMNKTKTKKCDHIIRSPKGKDIPVFCFVCPSDTEYWKTERELENKPVQKTLL
ncbi:MAG: hypothetical protein PHC43_00045 [Candidatus Marinimicrobia bacterium]|jgi:hypothetical protein|nr:hypothetical protein [Candidatus Neomarinimicrobiota bacterium]